MALSLKAFWNWVTMRLQKPKCQLGLSSAGWGGAADGAEGGMEVASDILSRAGCGVSVRHLQPSSSQQLCINAGINLPGVGVSFNGFREWRCEGSVRGVPQASSDVRSGEACGRVIRWESIACVGAGLARWLQLRRAGEVCR